MNARRLCAALVAIVALAPSASSAGSAGVSRALGALPPAARGAAERAMSVARQAHETGERVARAGSLDRVLVETARAAGIHPSSVAPTPAAGSILEAAVRLSTATGIPLGTGEAARLGALDAALPLRVSRAIAALASATADAATLRNRAFARLRDPERMLMESVLRRHQVPEARLVREIAGNVDLPLLVAASSEVLRAVEAALPVLREGWAPVAAIPPPPARPLNVESCPSATDSTGLVWIGTSGPDCYAFDHVLSIDPDGDDIYFNNAGGSNLVALFLDLRGNDRYHCVGVATGAELDQSEFGVEGAGVGGIGILVDTTGNDRYNSEETLDAAPGGTQSAPGARVGHRVEHSLGAGFFGVGIFADLAGADLYNSRNSLHHRESSPADFTDMNVGWSLGSGLGGIGVFVDAGEEGDEYNSFNTVLSDRQKRDPLTGEGGSIFAVRSSQGSGWGMNGVGAMVDLGGDDHYNSRNMIFSLDNEALDRDAAPASFQAECVQGVADAVCEDPNPSEGGLLGLFVDGSGADKYISGNAVSGPRVPVGGGLGASYSVVSAQGSAKSRFSAAGIMVEGLADTPFVRGSDQYNSWNVIQAFESAARIQNVQGVALNGGLGVLADAGNQYDEYNSRNYVITVGPNEEFGAGDTSSLTIECAQGCAVASYVTPVPAVAVHADARAASGPDAYNSGNGMYGRQDMMVIRHVQGFAWTIGLGAGLAAMIDENRTLLSEEVNTGNFTLGEVTNASLTIEGAQGVVAPASPTSAAVYVSIGGENAYNSNNLFGTVSVSSVQAVAQGLSGVAAMVDIDGVDTYDDNGASVTPPALCDGNAVLVDLDGSAGEVPGPYAPCLWQIDG